MPTPNEFSKIDFSRGPVPRDASEQEGSSFGPYPGPDIVPPETRSNAQFSSDNSGDPESLAADSMDSQNAFAELQTFLMNNLETPGTRVCHPQSKPWTPPHGAEGEK
jgi:hypothetical protein